MAATTGTSIAWSLPVYIDYEDTDVVINITSPFVSIESSFSSYINQGHMVVASNFNHGTSSYTSALNLITTSGCRKSTLFSILNILNMVLLIIIFPFQGRLFLLRVTGAIKISFGSTCSAGNSIM